MFFYAEIKERHLPGSTFILQQIIRSESLRSNLGANQRLLHVGQKNQEKFIILTHQCYCAGADDGGWGTTTCKIIL